MSAPCSAKSSMSSSLLLAGLLAVAGPDRRVARGSRRRPADEHRLAAELAGEAVEGTTTGRPTRGAADEHVAGDARDAWSTVVRLERLCLGRRSSSPAIGGHLRMLAGRLDRLVAVHALLERMDPPAVVAVVVGPHVAQAAASPSRRTACVE